MELIYWSVHPVGGEGKEKIGWMGGIVIVPAVSINLLEYIKTWSDIHHYN